ncbi:GNAT family N-acetyltransferase [Streptomyces sp. NPDC048248]|uniref:GNAT family N-acetyltransferase n=1 Tax=Streptomyces sp. NPDC048248 TaxID=3365523 RepID=UPI003723C4D7
MAGEVRAVSGRQLESYADGIRAVYTEAFGGPPWAEGPTPGDAYLSRLVDDARRPGFRAALALHEGTVLGFATAWTTPALFPTSRCYPQATAALGAERTMAWLCGAQEIDELAVHTQARGGGLGAGLLGALTAEAAHGRSWLFTSVRAESAVAFYRRLGWRQATHPAPGGNGAAVFLGPHHPAEVPAALLD